MGVHSISNEWRLWEKLIGNGREIASGAREIVIEEAVDAFLNGITDDPAYQAEALVEGENVPLVASRKSTLECDIKAAPGSDLHIGDVVECFNEHWIVVELYEDKIGILNGTMWICNNTIRFQNRSSNVNSRFCVIDDGSYSRKTNDPVAFIPTNTYSLYLSMDAETTKLYIDKRLSFGKIFTADGNEILEVYKITGIDLKSKNFGSGSHLMILTLQRDVYNDATDDLNNNLCDVYIESQQTTAPSLSGSCMILGRDVIRIGTTRKYTAKFTKPDGNVVDGELPIWEIHSSKDITTNTLDDGTVTISVPLKESLIGQEIVLTVKDKNGTYGTFEKKVQVVTIG